MTLHVDFQDHASSKCMIRHIFFDLLASTGGIKSSSVCVRNVAFEATSTSFQFQAQVIGLNQTHCFHIHFRFPFKNFGFDLGFYHYFLTSVQGKELLQLFGAYGTVTSCRLPKKADYSGHRGLASKQQNQRSELGELLELTMVLCSCAAMYWLCVHNDTTSDADACRT